MDKFKDVRNDKGEIRISGRYFTLIYETKLNKNCLFGHYTKVFKSNLDTIVYIAHLEPTIEYNFYHTKVLIDTIKNIDWKSTRSFNFGIDPYILKLKKSDWNKHKEIIQSDIKYFPNDEKLNNNQSILEYVNKNKPRDCLECINFNICNQYVFEKMLICDKCIKTMKPDEADFLKVKANDVIQKETFKQSQINRLNSLDSDKKIRDIINLYLENTYIPPVNNTNMSLIQLVGKMCYHIEFLEEKINKMERYTEDLVKKFLDINTNQISEITTSGLLIIKIGNASKLTNRFNSSDFSFFLDETMEVSKNHGLYVYSMTHNYEETIKTISRKTHNFNNIQLYGYLIKIHEDNLIYCKNQVREYFAILENTKVIIKGYRDLFNDKYYNDNKLFAIEDFNFNKLIIEPFLNKFHSLNCLEIDISKTLKYNLIYEENNKDDNECEI